MSHRLVTPELVKTRDLTLGLAAYVRVSVPDGSYLSRAVHCNRTSRLGWTRTTGAVPVPF